MKYERIIKGDLIIEKGCKDDFSEVVEITGHCYISSNVELPKLENIGGYCDIRSNVEFKAPKLENIGGSCDISSNVEFKASKNLKKNSKGKETKEYCLKFSFNSFLKFGFLFADNILAKIIEHKKNVYKIKICGQTKISYCIEADGVFSHGDTIKQAKESLIYKISNRDTSIYKDFTLDTQITFEEAIKMYRCITGACEAGTKHFVENILTVKKKKYTIQEVINLTENQYNNEKLKEFFKK